MKKISIILPVYNGAIYVGDAIESILCQSHTNFELIIVNDCSTDNTLQILEKYAYIDSRIKIINNQTNQKLPRSLNIGFKESTGEYLTWTSDDNKYHKEALEKMATILDNDLSIDLVYTDFTIVDMQGNTIEEIKEGEPDEIRYRDVIGACFLYRKSLADIVGVYDEETFLAEDYDFFLRCYMHGSFYHIKEDLYDYGRNEKSLSTTYKNKISYQAFQVMMKHFDFIISQCNTQEEKNKLYFELLTLLNGHSEFKKYRKLFYKLDKKFAKLDLKKRIFTALFTTMSFPFLYTKKIIKKILKFLFIDINKC